MGSCYLIFSPWPTPLSSGVNVFAQPVPTGHNIYVFPPFLLMGPLLRFLIDQPRHIAFKVIVPDLRPRRYWWAILQSTSVDRHRLGLRESVRTLLYPSQRSSGFHPKPLQWDLISHRFRVLGRPPAAVVPVYTRMIWTPIFVKHVVRPSIYRRLPRKQEILTSLQLNGVSTNLPLPFVANLISFKNIVYRTTSQNFCWPCPPKTITSCTADDVIKFLISRDGGGRTVIHDPSYPKDKCRFPSIRICSL